MLRELLQLLICLGIGACSALLVTAIADEMDKPDDE